MCDSVVWQRSSETRHRDEPPRPLAVGIGCCRRHRPAARVGGASHQHCKTAWCIDVGRKHNQ